MNADLVTARVFSAAIRDLPYLISLLVMLVIMPWRIFYIIEVIVGFRKGFEDRRKFFNLAKNIIKDYLCILLTMVLIFTIIKAKKAVKLALKNFRLNFFVGFLKYSYYQELKEELKSAGWFYHNAFFLSIAMIADWPRAH